MDRLLADVGVGQGLGVAIATALILALRVALSASERRRAWPPFVLLVLHVVALLAASLIPDGSAFAKPVDLAALGLLLLSVARSGFLLVIHGLLRRGVIGPLPKIFQDIIQIVVIAAVSMVVLRAAGVEPGSLLTTSALLTAVIGLSLQDTLGNLFAGLAIQGQRPFDAGDWIQFDRTPEHVGKVLEMNWRSVRILTLEHVEVTVPNSVLADAPIRNYSKPANLVRRSAYVVAPYRVPPCEVQAILTEAAAGVSGVLRDPPPDVLTQEFTERGVQYWVRYFIGDFGQRELIDGEVRSRLWYALSRAQIEIPPPLRDVALHEITTESEQSARAAARRERARGIRQVDFLRHLPDETIERLAEASRVHRYAPGEVIIRADETGDSLYVIEEGETVVLVRGPAGREIEVARLGVGDFFGEMSLMTGAPRRATVRAVTACETLVVRREAVRSILEPEPELAELISRKLAEREAALEATQSTLDAEAADGRDLDDRATELLDRVRRLFSL